VKGVHGRGGGPLGYNKQVIKLSKTSVGEERLSYRLGNNLIVCAVKNRSVDILRRYWGNMGDDQTKHDPRKVGKGFKG